MALLEALAEKVGQQQILTGAQISEKYQHDWSAEPAGLPVAVVRPGSTDEVSAILALCSAHGQKVVVQGGLTGLCGGANPKAEE
ncbi:MAG: FAD-binding protein, partial [Pseudohongiellaceae bacterium]